MALTFELVVDRQTARDALRAVLHCIFFHRLFGVVKPTNIDCLDVIVPAVKDAETEALVDDTVDRFLRALNAATTTTYTTPAATTTTTTTSATIATTAISTAGAATSAALALARGGVPALMGGGGNAHGAPSTGANTAAGTANGKKDGEIEVFFTEKKQKKATWFNSGGEEEVPWETWVIKVTLDQPQSDQDREALHATLSHSISKAVMSMVEYTASERGRAAVPVISTATGISPFPIHTVLRVKGQVVS